MTLFWWGRYERDVPPEARTFAKQHGFGKSNWFVPGCEEPPYYPPSVRRIFQKVKELPHDD